MKKFIGFEKGMGIGGWLTNYKRFNCLPMDRRLVLTIGDFEHFRGYITEKDVRYINKYNLKAAFHLNGGIYEKTDYLGKL